MNILILGMTLLLAEDISSVQSNVIPVNSSKYNDMFVIRATTYQIGILTNDTNTNSSSSGDQVAVTLYHKNGSDINLDDITNPLLTNVTGERMVGVTSFPAINDTIIKTWQSLNNIMDKKTTSSKNNGIYPRQIAEENSEDSTNDYNQDSAEFGLSYNDDDDDNSKLSYWKRSTADNTKNDTNKTSELEPVVKFVEGSAVIPQDVAITSLTIPPLVLFNNNISEIPIPIPNTSIIHYSKVNTLMKSKDS